MTHEGSDIADSVTPKQAAAPASSDALPGASISHVSDKTESPLHAEDTRETTTEEETREKGSWNCCLPSYSQLAYQPIGQWSAFKLHKHRKSVSLVCLDTLSSFLSCCLSFQMVHVVP